MRQVGSGKYVGETKDYSFFFLALLGPTETISTAVGSATVFSGNDPSPGNIISGGATISGPTVVQAITGGVVGTIYDVAMTIVTSLGQTLQINQMIPVLAGQP